MLRHMPVNRYRDGRLGVIRNPAGAPAARWCEAVKARPVIRAARRHSGDIPAAARALGIAFTEHCHGPGARQGRAARIEAGVAWARRSGVLHEFHSSKGAADAS
jgi:hypothetical protein